MSKTLASTFSPVSDHQLSQTARTFFSRCVTRKRVTQRDLEQAAQELNKSCCIVQVLNNLVLAPKRLTFSKSFHLGRLADLLCLLHYETRRGAYRLPDVEMLVCVGDSLPSHSKGLHSLVPALTITSGPAENCSIPVPIHSSNRHSVFRGLLKADWPSSNGSSFAQLFHAAGSRTIKWEKKLPVAFFRGQVRADSKYPACVSRPSWQQSGCVRSAVLAWLWNRTGFDVANAAEPNNYVPEIWWERYRYLLIVGNNKGWADRVMASLFKSSLSVLVDCGTIEWFYPMLQDRMHYLRATPDVGSIERAISWARAHDTEAQNIVEHANIFARTIFQPASLAAYVGHVSRTYKTGLAFEPQRRHGYGEPNELCL